MKIDVTTNLNFDLSKVDLDLSKEINLIGQKVVKDIKDGIETRKDLSGKSFVRLKPKTILRKLKLNLPRPGTPLFAEGKMKEVYISKMAKKTDQEAIVSPPKSMARPLQIKGVKHTTKRAFKGGAGTPRNVIGKYHNEGGTNLPKREWFGIRKSIIDFASKLIEKRIHIALEKVKK